MELGKPIRERHVRPNPKGGWDVSGADEKRAASHHETGSKAHAWALALLLETGGGKVKLYGRDGGLIREETV